MSKLRTFEVIGPLRIFRGSYLDYEPPEEGHDYWRGRARTAHEARRRAWLEWEKDPKSIVHENRSDRRHPMSDVKVERVPQRERL